MAIVTGPGDENSGLSLPEHLGRDHVSRPASFYGPVAQMPDPESMHGYLFPQDS